MLPPSEETAVEFRPLSMVTVVVVTFNSERVIEQCLRHVVPVLDQGGEVLVVDNASKDETVKRVESLDSRIVVIKEAENLGFAAAVNLAARMSNREVLCLLNPDAGLEAESLSRLTSVVLSDPSIGILGPLVTQEDGRSGNSGAGRFPTIWRTFCTLWGVSLLAGPEILEGTVLLTRQVRRARDVDWLTGACIVARRATWIEVGGLTERWFMYGEDIDLGMRVREAGLRTVVLPDLHVEHAVGGSSEGAAQSPIESAWLVNQYEFFMSSMSSGRFENFLWKWTAVAGVCIRALAHSVLSLWEGSSARMRGRWLLRCARDLVRTEAA